MKIFRTEGEGGCELEYEINAREDYAGLSCTGKTISAAPLVVTHIDYHSFESAPPVGRQLTVNFQLVAAPTASALSRLSRFCASGRM